MAFDYKASVVYIISTISGYAVGDYAKIHSNNGSGPVVTTTPHDENRYEISETYLNNEKSVGVSVASYGWWIFSLYAYDKADNAHVGTPDEQGIWPLLQPVKPTRPVIRNFDNTTKTLTISRS